MTREELFEHAVEVAKSIKLPLPSDAEAMHTVLDDLVGHWDTLPESSRAMLLGLAAIFCRRATIEKSAEIRADMAICRARGVAPSVVLVDHSFVVEVTQEDDMLIAECDAIGLVTEAPSIQELVDRAMLIIPALIIENNALGDSENAQLYFRFKQLSAA